MTETTKPASKPGVKTSEFWITIAVKAVLTILFSMGKIPGDLYGGLLAGNGAAYTGMRTVAKVKAGKQ